MTATANDCITTLQRRYGLSYHVDYAFHAEELVGLRGKRVLEVGGSLPQEFVHDVLGVGAWVALEEPSYWAETLTMGRLRSALPQVIGKANRIAAAGIEDLGAYSVFFGGIEELPASLAGYFDVIFSIFAFEHIARLPSALEKMHQALRPGGKVYAMTTPLWSARHGHNLPERADDRGRRWNGSHSPVPPWGHLLLRPMELYDVLLAQCDKDTAQEIVYYVYSSPHINRLFLEDYQEVVARSPFKVNRLTPQFPLGVPDDVQEQLRVRYPGRKDFSHNGLLMVLER